jgi:hypothetical protein
MPIGKKVVGIRDGIVDQHGNIQGPQGPGDGGDMEARVAKLEAHAEHLQSDITDIKNHIEGLRTDISGIRTTDFRLIFGAIITVALGLAWLMAKGFHWL